MRRLAISLFGLVWIGCTSSPPERAPTADRAEPAPKRDVEQQPSPPSPTPPPPPSAEPCERKIERYLAERAELSHCEADSDCSEMWPGLCPHGPYYIHRDADIAPVFQLEAEIMKSCEVPECEAPIELGIARCEGGRCVQGRSAPASSGHESCWDYQEIWLEGDGSASGKTAKNLQGITPHVAIAPAQAGALMLEIDWPAGCVNCRLMISEHNSGMSQLIEPRSVRTDAERNGQPIVRERLEFPVTPGPYHMVALADSDADYLIRAGLRDEAGGRGRVTRHGVGWQRMCEG